LKIKNSVFPQNLPWAQEAKAERSFSMKLNLIGSDSDLRSNGSQLTRG